MRKLIKSQIHKISIYLGLLTIAYLMLAIIIAEMLSKYA
ncbi:hypothetical protein FNFX1_0486 [Francisella cf. novicida Fx1]|nr:hypothetical protein FTH_0471 [Francisella tularensis subsp. holarctica OSU18]AEB27434.1 hypothetical protein FNFX1_0486 [Francisella cf. novicida Fx1]APA82551.1 hypothetical protein N894_0567 [Francisella tularensis subsp. novicida PA10-7858]